jgi:hypothetical protein
MACDVVIRAEGLGKKYVIGHETERERYMALRDVATRTARSLWKRAVDTARGGAIVRGDATEEFWALKNVSFEVKRRAREAPRRCAKGSQFPPPAHPGSSESRFLVLRCRC